MKKYEEFLEQVKDKNQDEFSDIQDIITRYTTLCEANTKLKAKQLDLE